MQYNYSKRGSQAVKAAFAAMAVAATGVSGVAQAATQGSLGATSTGSISISASVPTRARLSGLNDVAFTNQDPATPATDAQDVCAWSNTATKGYTITATGSGAGNAFTLANGALTVPYSVEWNENAGQTTGTALTAGSASSGFVSTATNQLCASGPSASASLIITIASADLQTMQAATNYTGTLTLVMTPQ